ncbi:MAG TPA: methyltransferase domain-containing protein, partial [Opitutaceae bacterium]
WEARFDLVLLVGVLEHVREAGDAVRAAARLLAPGGLLYCAVPDVEGFLDCSGGPYQQFSTEHVNFFSTLSRDRLFGACGLATVQSWRWTVEWRKSVAEPIASALYAPGAALDLPFDAATGPSLERYAALSGTADRPIRSAVESLRESQEPIVVWGAGTLARRLLATTRFAEANIRAFVDSNPHLRGKSLAGRPIVPGEAMAGWSESILICSVTFEFEIAEAIRGHGFPNRILSLSGREFA